MGLRFAPILLLLAACGGAGATSTGDRQTTAALTATTSAPPEVRAQPASRTFSRATTFAELVGRARSLEASGDGEREARCLVGATDEALSLNASVVPAIRPLPDAPADLDARLARASRVIVLSRWGRAGEGALAVATFTPAAPSERFVVVVLTPSGLYLRATDGARPLDRVAYADLSTPFAALAPGESVIVTAEAETPVARLEDVLRALAARDVHAALAVVLPEAAPIPGEPEGAARTTDETCASLPPLRDDAAMGDLAVGDVRRGAAALADVALACARSTSSFSVARGGRLQLLMRIGPDGGVVDACAQEDTIADDGFRMCIVGAARRLAFTPPSPPGYVDVRLPVRVLPDASSAITPLCAH